MTCCLNSACHNPPHPDGVNFCFNCGVPLIVLRNRYRPIKSLGGGGFGKTYLAEDIDKLNEPCVIKQFAPQVQGTASLNKATELFEQEAKRLQQLGKHPQIPTLLAYFNEDNRLYLVQEFIEGQNLLTELQQQGIFNEHKVRELLLDLLNILTTVHQQQVIHRDIKPENMIRRGDGKMVLIDFGASKQLTATVVTQVGTTIGSFGYAPLEQMQGGEAYPASDLYSVGATCFHMLSGIHPWELWKRQGYGWVASWRQHLQQPISEHLGNVVDRLLQEEFHQRYHSATEVLQALNFSPLPPTQPVTPPVSFPPLPVTQAVVVPDNSPPRTKKSIPLYLLVIPLILLMGAGTVYLPGLVNSLKVEQKSADTLYNEGVEKYNKKDLTGAIADFTQAIKINPNLAVAYNDRGLARYDSGDRQAAIEDYNQAIKANPNLAVAYYNRGLARYDLGDKQTAIEDYTQAVTINPNNANAYYNRGLTRYELGDKQTAIEDYTQAIKVDPNYANAYYNRGLARYDIGDKQTAIEDYTQAIAIRPEYANAYIGRGLARSDLGNKQAAIADYTEAIRINPNSALAYYNRGIDKSDLGDKQGAIDDYTQSIKLNPNDADTYYNRGNDRGNLGDRRGAIADYTQAIAVNPNYANAYYNRGNAHSNLGNKQAAIEDFRKAADLYQQQGNQRQYQDALNRVRELEK
ncbi:TPR domain protein [Nostoc sp. NIES-3756]|uniref:tetratricopeptide repeat protein n=1 Tax=Nostoc sp. NIES-3756 TaxID=1751286 RepID=UPI0007224CAD|nr:tetratricopeptide repeat protein [Nostoc sp. NIES-3756]BAT56404.1 TPR domain protein [Nostoc sp. NIES-3756]BAY35844.1 TPR domain protein [Nostoc sp. NIES-2111]